MKAILAEKKREAEEKAAALRAENEAIFKAEREKLALEASKAPERTPEIKPEIVVVSPVSAPVEKKVHIYFFGLLSFRLGVFLFFFKFSLFAFIFYI